MGLRRRPRPRRRLLRRFLQALEKVDRDIPVNIEHEDQELPQLDGLRCAAQTLLEAAAVAA